MAGGQLSVYSVSIGAHGVEEVHLAVHECSPPEGYRKVPIVCVPGLWTTARSFDDLICRFAASAGRRVIALSMRGHGASSQPAGGIYSVSEAAYDVAAALRVLALDSAVLLGHGVGAMIVTRVATLEPERVAALILCSGVRKLKMTANWGGRDRATCTFDSLVKRITVSNSDDQDPCMTSDILWKAVEELTLAREQKAESSISVANLEDIKRSDPSALRAMLKSSLVSELSSDALAAYTGRTLLLWGTSDVFSTLTEQLELLRLLKPRAELKQIDGGDHYLLWDSQRKGAVCEAVTEFVLSLDSATSGPRRSKSMTAALQAYGDAVARTLQKVESKAHELPEQTLKNLLTAAAGSLLPPPPPPNKGDRSISEVRNKIKLMSVSQLEDIAAKLQLKVKPDSSHEKLCETLMACATFVRAMRTQPQEEILHAQALAEQVADAFVEKTRNALQAEWEKRDADRATFESRLPDAASVRARVRGERNALSKRRIRKLVETQSFEDLKADWMEWLSNFEQRSDAMSSFKDAVSGLRASTASD